MWTRRTITYTMFYGKASPPADGHPLQSGQNSRTRDAVRRRSTAEPLQTCSLIVFCQEICIIVDR